MYICVLLRKLIKCFLVAFSNNRKRDHLSTLTHCLPPPSPVRAPPFLTLCTSVPPHPSLELLCPASPKIPFYFPGFCFYTLIFENNRKASVFWIRVTLIGVLFSSPTHITANIMISFLFTAGSVSIVVVCVLLSTYQWKGSDVVSGS